MRRWFALVVLIGCGEDSRGPVPIALGEDTCDACRMIISEAPYAAEARFGAKVEKFDDLGCLVRRLKRGDSPDAVWVKDRPSGNWIDGRKAYFVKMPNLKTPMASGLVAYAGRPEGTGVMAFEDLAR